MQSDPLQQLRDVHMPADPSWWPPAPGWWVLGVLLVFLLLWAYRKYRSVQQRRVPIRMAQSLLGELYGHYQRGSLSAMDFLQQSNELLKRLLVPALGHQRFARLSGDAWLEQLDQLSRSDAFTNGPGRVLGNERFRADPEVDVDALHQQLQRTLKKVRA